MKNSSLFKHIFLLIFLFVTMGHVWCMNYLNRNSFYFITDKKPLPECVHLTKTYEHHHRQEKKIHQVVDIMLTTTSGVACPARFFDNNRDRVIVLGQGFFCDSNVMQDFVSLLGSDFDYITFDYRWKEFASFALNPSTYLRPQQKIFYDEQEEVLAVVRFVKSRKEYREVIGLGQCYSSFLFVVAQAEEQIKGKQLFSRLILDSCWYSLNQFARNVGKDFGLIANPQKGGSFLLQKICASYALESLIAGLIQCLPDVTIQSYAAQLKNIPVLFIHGMNDKLIPIESFTRVWHTVQAPKSLLLTPHRHADNLQSDGMMIQACQLFLQSSSVNDFVVKMKQ